MSKPDSKLKNNQTNTPPSNATTATSGEDIREVNTVISDTSPMSKVIHKSTTGDNSPTKSNQIDISANSNFLATLS